ncbi:MAG: lysozyme [Alphaproteobacteria bacterium]|nr:lysozyme [Alphaproteobacteria bacterium]
MTTRVLSPAGFAAIQAFEGFAATSVAIGEGRFVIGHGHLEDAPRATAIDAAAAADLLRADLAPVEAAVAATLYAPVSQAQFDALVSFAFSIGVEAFLRSPVLIAFNAGHPLVAAEAMGAWRFSAARGAPTMIDALARRRAAEQALFLTLDPPVSAPSVAVRPIVPDAEAMSAAPDASEATERLKRIFASRPETAVALSPPPAAPAAAPNDDPPLPIAKDVARSGRASADAIALTALGAFGAALVLAGIGGLMGGGPHAGLAFVVFGGSGALAGLISLYFLARLGA